MGYGPSRPDVPRGGPSLSHEFHDFMIDGAGKVWHGIRAYAILRSVLSGLRVEGAINIGVELSYGFINRIENCNFIGSSVGIKSANQANAVVIANNNFEGQSFAAIIVGNSQGGMVIEGNEMEGIGGPAIIIFGMTSVLCHKFPPPYHTGALNHRK